MSDFIENALYRVKELMSGAYVVEAWNDGEWQDTDYIEYESHDLARVSVQRLAKRDLKTFYYDKDGNQF